MLPKNRPPSQSSMCDFLFIAVLNGTDTANSLGVFCSTSHLSNPRVLLLHTLYSPYSILPKNRRLAVFRSKSPPSYSRGNKHQCPPKKEEDWVFSAPSHLQVIQEETDINSLPKKRKLGCSLPQVTSK